MSIRTCARFSAPLTILLAPLSTAVAADSPANSALPVTCNATIPEDAERLMRKLKVTARVATVDSERVISVKLVNRAKSPALATWLTLVDTSGRPLPATYSDNCVSVSRGEPATISIRYSPASADAVALRIEGWNVESVLARIPAEAVSQPYLPQPWQQPVYAPPAPTVKSATVVLPKK